jgi:CHAD domain-containing protein
MQQFGLTLVSKLLDDLVFALHHAARLQDVDSVHKMRVAIRRFVQALRTFKDFLPDGPSKKIQKRLHHIMQLSGDLRNCDIAIKLLTEMELQSDQIASNRVQAKQILRRTLKSFSRPDLSGKWRTKLDLRV